MTAGGEHGDGVQQQADGCGHPRDAAGDERDDHAAAHLASLGFVHALDWLDGLEPSVEVCQILVAASEVGTVGGEHGFQGLVLFHGWRIVFSCLSPRDRRWRTATGLLWVMAAMSSME